MSQAPSHLEETSTAASPADALQLLQGQAEGGRPARQTTLQPQPSAEGERQRRQAPGRRGKGPVDPAKEPLCFRSPARPPRAPRPRDYTDRWRSGRARPHPLPRQRQAERPRTTFWCARRTCTTAPDVRHSTPGLFRWALRATRTCSRRGRLRGLHETQTTTREPARADVPSKGRRTLRSPTRERCTRCQ